MSTDTLLHFLKNLIPVAIFRLLQPVYHFLLSFLAALTYGFPSRHLFVVGVTGTKGKTTVVELCHRILEESGAGVASLSSLRFRIGARELPNLRKMTMPGRFFVQKFLHQSLRAGCRYAVLEVTSEGIKQFRHRFISFDAAILTNVAPEHIESHGSFERYLRAKLDLFFRLPREGIAIINRDDQNAGRFRASTRARVVSYSNEGISVHSRFSPVTAAEIKSAGLRFELAGTSISSPLLGSFNLSNVLAASALGLAEHLTLEKIASAVKKVEGVPGRMEILQEEPFWVVVDYAHTPDSLKLVYAAVRKIQEERGGKGRLVCVLGAAGGGRDRWKRPVLGRIASQMCERVILTNEDPYDEDPSAILAEIGRGATLPYETILDRREAIRAALSGAERADLIVITGKGAEPWIMGPNQLKTPWDERVVVRELLKERAAGGGIHARGIPR